MYVTQPIDDMCCDMVHAAIYSTFSSFPPPTRRRKPLAITNVHKTWPYECDRYYNESRDWKWLPASLTLTNWPAAVAAAGGEAALPLVALLVVDDVLSDAPYVTSGSAILLISTQCIIKWWPAIHNQRTNHDEWWMVYHGIGCVLKNFQSGKHIYWHHHQYRAILHDDAMKNGIADYNSWYNKTNRRHYWSIHETLHDISPYETNRLQIQQQQMYGDSYQRVTPSEWYGLDMCW